LITGVIGSKPGFIVVNEAAAYVPLKERRYHV
jgi:hypothetical protein